MITQVLAAVLLLGICIFFHELGHFLLGKLAGVQPKVFSIGYGRGIWFKKIGRTIYQVTAIPLGGYVQFHGEDPTKPKEEMKKGDFFSVGPWRRILLAAGGPLFSFLLGFIVIFILVLSGWQPMANSIEVREGSPAYEAGLRTGDRVTSINGHETDSFEKVGYEIAFTETPDITLTYQRDGEEKTINTTVNRRSAGSIYTLTGMRPAGESYLTVAKGRSLPDGALIEGDRIVKADGQRVETVTDLQSVLNSGDKSSVKLTVHRDEDSLIDPSGSNEITLTAPLKDHDYLVLKDVFDVQTERKVDDIEIYSTQKQAISRIRVNNRSFSDFNSLKQALNKKTRESSRVQLEIGTISVRTDVEIKTRKLIGISLSQGVEAQKADHPLGLVSAFTRSYDQTVFVTEGTLLGLYRIFQGKLSFTESAAGPVKIAAIAAESVSSGWDTYFFLLAQITIILGIMNLLPIPVLDGGHIVFYLIEAVYKPVPIKVMAVATRIGMAVLLTFGIYIIGQDIWDVWLHRLFN